MGTTISEGEQGQWGRGAGGGEGAGWVKRVVSRGAGGVGAPVESMVVETIGVVVVGGDEELAMEEASSMAVEGTAVEAVENTPVDTWRVEWVLVVLVARVVCGWLLVVGGLVLVAVGGEVVETRVVCLCGVLSGATVTTAVGLMVGQASAGLLLVGALVLAGVASEVLGARVELQGVVRGGQVTALGVAVCSLGMDRCGEKVAMGAFAIVSSPSPYSSSSSSSASPTLPQLGLKLMMGLSKCSGGLWHTTFSGATSTFVFSRPRSG